MRYKLFRLGLMIGLLSLSACGPAGLYKPPGKGPFPAVIVLHTSGGISEYLLNFALDLSSKGYVTLAVDYLSGHPGNDSYVIIEELQIISDAYDQLKANPIVDPNRIGMVGFSLGTNRALGFASTYPDRKIKAIVNYYSGCWTCAVQYPLSGGRFPAVLFLHGELDESTHPQRIKNYCLNLKTKGQVCEFHIYEGVYHAFDNDSPNYSGGIDHVTTADAFKRAVVFLDTHVKSKSKYPQKERNSSPSHKISIGMTKNEVSHLLGSPMSVEQRGDNEAWKYLRMGSVVNRATIIWFYGSLVVGSTIQKFPGTTTARARALPIDWASGPFP